MIIIAHTIVVYTTMKGERNMLRRIFSYMGEYKKYMYLAVICITGESVFELVIPLIMANILDIGVTNQDKVYIFQQGGIMLVCALPTYEKRSTPNSRNFLLQMWIIFSSLL